MMAYLSTNKIRVNLIDSGSGKGPLLPNLASDFGWKLSLTETSRKILTFGCGPGTMISYPKSEIRTPKVSGKGP